MASTLSIRADAIRKHQTTKALYGELRSLDSFALDQAMRLPAACRLAAACIADSPLPLNSDTDTVNALIHCGYRPSLFTEWLDGMRCYANNRRSTS